MKPVAQAARGIPFHLRSKVEAAFDNLEKQDIRKKVSGPTSWVSPKVVAPKAHDKEKYALNKSNLDFLGFVFSKRGMPLC